MSSVSSRASFRSPLGGLPAPVQVQTPAPKLRGFCNLPLPGWEAQRNKLVPDPLPAPDYVLKGVNPEVTAPTGPLQIRGSTYSPVGLEKIQPGDIGFDYRAAGRSWRQNLIAFGERIQNLTRPDRAGSSNVLHAFVVLQSYPRLGIISAADAATGTGPFGVMLTDLDLGASHTKDAFHVFFRFKDPRMRLAVATIARNWGYDFVPNFNSYNAVRSVWQDRDLSPATQARLLKLSSTSPFETRMVDPDNQQPYQVMCSEFVSNVGASAAMTVYAEDHPGTHLGDPETLRALAQGPAGSVFNANPASLTPSALAARLAADPQVETVGYLYALG